MGEHQRYAVAAARSVIGRNVIFRRQSVRGDGRAADFRFWRSATPAVAGMGAGAPAVTVLALKIPYGDEEDRNRNDGSDPIKTRPAVKLNIRCQSNG